MENDELVMSAARHIEQVWACRVRRVGDAHMLTANDRVVNVAAIVAHQAPAATHEWLDVPLRLWREAREVSVDARCPAIVVARYDDAVVWVAQATAGPFATLCGDDCKPRVRIMRNRMTLMRYESRW